MEPVQDEDLTGQTVGPYRIVALIGTGGQGRVYRGLHRRLPREVAIKVLASDRLCDPAARRSLVLEASALSRLSHPHVAGIHDLLSHSGRDFLVMEFVPGATLRDVLAGGPLPPWEVLRLGAQMARGLAAAHAANIVHRDVNPSNIKITTGGELKILDFGLAKLLRAGALLDNASRTPTDAAVVGTIPYMSPEQLRGDAADPRGDVFSAGVVLYEMATGCPAFPQRSLATLIEAIQHVEPQAPSAVNPLVPLALEDVIVRAMQKDPRDRQQGALEMAASLEELAPVGRFGAPAGTLLPAFPGSLARAAG